MEERKKRLSLTVTDEMETALNDIQRRSYPGASRSEMLRDLICRGIAELKRQKAGKEQCLS